MTDHRGQCWRKHAWMARPLWWGVPSAPAYWALMYEGGSAISLTTLSITNEDWAEGGGDPMEINNIPVMWDTCPAFLPQAQAKYRHVQPAILNLEWPDHSPVDVTEGYNGTEPYSDIWCGPFILWDDSPMESRMYSENNQCEYQLFPQGKTLEWGTDPYDIVEDRVVARPWEALNVDYLPTDLVNLVDNEITFILDRLLYTAIGEDLFDIWAHMTDVTDALESVNPIKHLLDQQAQEWADMLERRDDPCSSSQLHALRRLRLAS